MKVHIFKKKVFVLTRHMNLFFNKDLDEKITKEGFDKVMKEDLFKDERQMQWNMPQFFGFSQSSSVQRIRRPDGVRSA